MYQLPDQPAGGKYIIDDDIVTGRRKLFAPLPAEQRKSA
jgi:hypothetical protein